jgi:hypothetical protein
VQVTDALGQTGLSCRLTKESLGEGKSQYDLPITGHNGIINKKEESGHSGGECEWIQTSCRFLSVSRRRESRLLKFSGNGWRRETRADSDVAALDPEAQTEVEAEVAPPRENILPLLFTICSRVY